MTENEKRYDDFVRALKELCRSHGVGLGLDENYELAIWTDDGAVDCIKNRLDK